MCTRQVLWALVVCVLVSCGGGSGDLPPVRPSGTVSGNAMAAAIQDGRIAVYALGRNGKGALLGTTTTDAQGHFSLDLRAPSQPVLIELSGGRYVEEANGVTVNVAEGQVLRAVARYQSGRPLSVMVTPLTHLAAALAEYRVAQGSDPGTAVDTALRTVEQAFGMPVTDVLPQDISAPAAGAAKLSVPYTYGFFLAALSSFAEWVNGQNNVPAHTVYTSLSLCQVMYNDIRSDGVLDGRGLNKAGDAIMDLALGTVALNQDVYRIAIAQHLLAVSAGAQNKTGLGRNDLLDVARSFSTSTSPLFGGKAPADTSAFAPGIVPKLAAGSTFNGIYNFAVDITGVLGAEHVSFDVDGVAVGDALDPAHPALDIDTRGYADGKHRVGVTATDFLGLSNHQVFTYRFNNVFVDVTSAPASNHSPFTLTGTYGDNGFGFKSLTVQGKAVTPNADQTWSAQVNLTLGRNHIPIVLETQQGASASSDAIVDYDVGLPAITAAGHGDGCFSNGNGGCDVQPLADRNENAPLYIETDHTELAGVAVTRTALSDNAIPFFALTANDPLSNGVGTPADQLKVRLQYEKNGNVIVPWFALTAVNGEYLLPLATELLSDAWLRSAPTDIQALRVEVEDLAGNITSALFTFKVDFVVAPFAMDAVVDSGGAVFAGTAFTNRASLYNTTVTVEEYPFANTTGKGFYISPGDNSVHDVDNLIDQLVRENKVRLKSATEWRAGFVENVLQYDQCPSLPQDGSGADKWTPVTQVLNYAGGGVWNPVAVPDATFGSTKSVSTDNPTAPSPSAWSQVADFDATYASGSATISPGLQLTYAYDYISSLPSFSKPAAVRNWKFVDATGAETDCPDVNFLQQREVYSYQPEPGYPQNIASTMHDGASFVTSGFTVFDVTANAPITPLSGWYLIPAGHAVVVRKQVTLPALTLHNDTDVADPGTFTSYTPHLYDHTLTWTIDRSMTMDVAHDGGTGNLFSMTSRQVQAGVGTASYQLSR
ncbi:MAG: hypothetical protein P8164_08655 [Gammaproteobacteria bacterium]|jgi:hypothetical protein